MDWSKAKNILLIVFLALNIILIYNIYSAFSGGRRAQEDIINNSIEVLSNRGVKIDCKIPSEKNGATIVYDNSQESKEEIARVLLQTSIKRHIRNGEVIQNEGKAVSFDNNTITYSDKNQVQTHKDLSVNQSEKILEEFLKKINIDLDDFQIDRQWKMSDNVYVLKYKQKFGNYIIFDNYIDARIGPDGVSILNCRYRKVKNIKKNPNQKIFDAYQILLKSTGLKDIRVKDINLGYKGIFDGETSSAYDVLTWCITPEEGKSLYYSALDGKQLDEV